MFIVLAKGSTAGSISQLITVLILSAFVLFITVYATKFVGSYQKMQGVNRNLEVIETLRITNNKYIQIVRAGNKHIVIGVGKDEISMLTEIDEADILKSSTEKAGFKESFSEILNKAGIKSDKDKDNDKLDD